MAGQALSFLAASLLLLGVLLPTNGVAAPADKDGHVVPTAIHDRARAERSEEHTSELQSPCNLVCRLLLEKKKKEDPHGECDAEIHIHVRSRVAQLFRV